MSKVYVKVPSTATSNLVEVYPREGFEFISAGVVRLVRWVTGDVTHERLVIGAIELDLS